MKKQLKRLANDLEYRITFFAFCGMMSNALFAIVNFASAIHSGSRLHSALAIYYFSLAFMRFNIADEILKARKSGGIDKHIEAIAIACKNSGIFMFYLGIAMNIFLFLILRFGEYRDYPGYLVFVVAIYTLARFFVTTRNSSRTKDSNRVYTFTFAQISHADSMVAYMSLLTALFNAIGFNNINMISTINSITAFVVCLFVMITGIRIRSHCRKNKEENEIQQ